MTKWSVAHRLAHMAAMRTLDDAGQPADRRTDVAALIAAANLRALADPEAERLFGLYIPPTHTYPGGIWINAAMPPSTQRHSAAHELGHHVFNHGLTCDTDFASLSATPATSTLTETTAEAFAAWLLMPRAALVRTLRMLNIKPEDLRPEHVYLTGLILGTSYRGTARHLGVARLIEPRAATALARTAPAAIKNRFDDPTAPPRGGNADVWPLQHLAGCGEVTLHHGDRLVLPATADAAAEGLIADDVAQFVHQSFTSIVLSATAPPDRNGAVRRHLLSLPGDDDGLQVSVESGPVRPRAQRAVPNVANVNSEADLDLLLTQQQAQRVASAAGEDPCV
ncbi:ImmA/IrrE family metallo-endopeptidase [Amycolatopsis sp. CA-128772]|uniref:ImmA/IrrE family metallo-endopeptidase n=1 Tax=Amycolatopsis sp. CA-128772 TaxID=2073159 RepID=UPI000CD32855|nr:ImmA/IrrE family metallo-endopeptidase [Amycolatopsis sp. CA-128772]